MPDAERDSVFVITAYELTGKPLLAYRKKETKETKMSKNNFPLGWDEDRVKRLIAHYERQTEDEAVAEDEAVYEDKSQTTMEVPTELVPAVRELLSKRTKS